MGGGGFYHGAEHDQSRRESMSTTTLYFSPLINSHRRLETYFQGVLCHRRRMTACYTFTIILSIAVYKGAGSEGSGAIHGDTGDVAESMLITICSTANAVCAHMMPGNTTCSPSSV